METLSITIHSRSEKKHELLNICRIISENSALEAGCLDSRVRHDTADKCRITIKQQWQGRHLLDAYFRSDHFSALLGAMKLLGKTYQTSINDGTPQEGLAAIQNARGK